MTILVVGSGHVLSHLMATLFPKHKLTRADTLSQGYYLLKEFGADVVVCDSSVDGLEALSWGVPCVVVVGSVPTERISECAKNVPSGRYTILRSPARLTEVVDAVERCIQQPMEG